MKRTVRHPILVALVLLLPAAGCSRANGKEGAAARPAVAVEVAPAVSGDLKESIEVVGTLAPKFQAEVKTEYSGTVTEVLVTEWVRVSKGTILLRFDAREAEAAAAAARASLLSAEVGMNRARRELDRTMKLKEAGLATPQNLDDAKTSSEAAEAQMAAAKAQKQMAETKLEKTVIRSPLDGVVASRTVNPGDFIENMGSPKPMFRIVDNRRLELTATVPSSRISGVRLGQPLSFTTDAVPGRTFVGKVAFINPAADESSRTVKVVALVDNRDESAEVRSLRERRDRDRRTEERPPGPPERLRDVGPRGPVGGRLRRGGGEGGPEERRDGSQRRGRGRGDERPLARREGRDARRLQSLGRGPGHRRLAEEGE